MAKAVGIDIGSHACKVAVLDGGPKGAKLLRFEEGVYQLAEGDVLTPAVVLDALRKALAKTKAPKNAASLALPAEQCVLREISVPFEQDDQIARVAKFEFEPHLHNAAIEDVVIDYLRTGQARAGTRLLIFCCEKDVLATRLTQLSGVGVDPLHVDVDVTALFNVAAAAGVFDENPTCLIIDIGARTTKTLFVQGGQLKVARSIRLGARSAQDRLTSDFQGDKDAANRAIEDAAGVEALAVAPDTDTSSTVEIVRSVAAVESAVARVRQDEFMTRVLRETQRTLPSLAEDGSISCVYLTGGGVSRHPNARDRLEERFGTEVRDLPVGDAIDHDLSPTEAEALNRSGAVAVGTALKVIGMDPASIDLRREEFRFARTFDQVKNALATGVTLLFFAVFLLALSVFMGKQKADRELGALQREAKANLEEDVFQRYEETVRDARSARINDDPKKYFSTTKSAISKMRGHLKNELGLSTEIEPIISSLEIWQAVMESVASVRKDVKFLAIKQEDYDQDKAVITFVLGDYTDVDTIADALRKHMVEDGGRLFETVTNRDLTTRNGRIEVPIELVLVPVSERPPEEDEETDEPDEDSASTDATDGGE